jgi:acyl carrier protein
MAISNDDAITQQVIAIFGEHFRIPSHELIADANLSEDLGLDSLDVMQVLFDLEECFDIEFPNDAAAQLQTLADIVSYVRRRSSTREEISEVKAFRSPTESVRAAAKHPERQRDLIWWIHVGLAGVRSSY